MAKVSKNSFLAFLSLVSLCFIIHCADDTGSKGIIFMPNPPTQNLDADGDGINDAIDNCVNDPNPNQDDDDGDGIGDVCDPVNDSVDPPNAPSNISANSGLNNCEISIFFTDNSTDEDGFILTRHFDINGGPSDVETDINIVSSSGTGTVSYVDSVGPPFRNVFYTVRAENEGGSSSESNPSSVISSPNCM